MNSSLLDWKILLSYFLVLFCGFLIGLDISSEKFSFLNLPAWLSAMATFLAVGVALYTTRLNIDRDRYKLECTISFKSTESYQVTNPFDVENIHLFNFNECKVRAVNTGLRPIAIERIKIQIDNNNWEEVSTSVRGQNGLPTTAVLEPGNFFEWFIPENLYTNPDKSLRLIHAYVVDAHGVEHLAQLK